MMSIKKGSFERFFTAASVYAVFAGHLYWPYFRDFNRLQYLFAVNVFLASSGCYVLSRRWVGGFSESLFSGAIYGFGPFMLGLARFHPSAGFLTAVIPWLFCPAAYSFRGKRRWLRIPLVVLPFLATVIFFQVTVHYRLFAVSTQARPDSGALAGLFVPLIAARRGLFLIGFYHVPIAGLVIGFCMMLAARRYSVVVLIVLGIALSFCDTINSRLEVSPVMWLAIPVLCCSLLIGEGMQGLSSAGYSDRVWVLVTVVIMAGLSILSLLLATKYFQTFLGLGAGYGRAFTRAGKIYVLGAIMASIIFFMIRAKLRMRLLRRLILCAAMGLDIYIGAVYIIDRFL
ncbi:MAG: hypothetical protein JW837_08595 [Sedimentisphaerales bacterium]|nr:hypothetical protein [Sedimentisphaerales bacterium]